MKFLCKSLLVAAILFYTLPVSGQLFEIGLNEKVANATVIAEGKVVQQRSFWNPAHTMIFTSNIIEVYKVFKGTSRPATIEIVTTGGTVDDYAIEASDLLSLDPGSIGTFFCYPNSINLKSPFTNNILMDVYSSSQGFIQYNMSDDKAYAPFAEYKSIETDFYPRLTKVTREPVKVINTAFQRADFIRPKSNLAARNQATASITSFSPATVTAGALNKPSTNVLTISGSGFGVPATGKQLIFKDGNSTNLTADFVLASTSSQYIISWTDNTIVLRVPSRVATGTFGLVTAIGDTGFAPNNLNVDFAVIEASFNSGTIIREPRLMNANNRGGYSIFYGVSNAGNGRNFTTDSALINFRNALKTWKDITGVNFIESGNTDSQRVAPNDTLNIIVFDNANTGNAPLAEGVLAVVYSGSRICNISNGTAQKSGFDMVIRNPGFSTGSANPFNKNDCGVLINTISLETVILHELGHALSLAHIYAPSEESAGFTTRNPSKVMHPGITPSVARRSLDITAYMGAMYTITPQNNANYGICEYLTEMTPLVTSVSPLDECPSAFPPTYVQPGTVVNVDLSKTTSNRSRDPQFRAIGTAGSTTGAGVSVINNAYYAIRTGSSGNLLFNIENYTTYPAAAITCPEQGVRMSLYAVNNCPTGQQYPAPVLVTTFNGNTSRTISGFAANTTYLFYIDGLYGTKAIFDIRFTGGTVLPITLRDFYGENTALGNKLSILLEAISGNTSIGIERSADGSRFTNIGVIPGLTSTSSLQQNFTDQSPLSGSNYYRLKFTDANGSFSYSKVILLTNNNAGKILVYPNPVSDNLTINLANLPTGRYMVKLSDIAGRQLQQISTGATTVNLSFADKAKGIYLLQIFQADGNILYTNKINNTGAR